MSRELISSSSYPLSSSNPSTSMKSSQSRIPVKAKRAPLGERIENHDHTNPRQHLVKSVKSVIRPRIISTKSNASPLKSSTYRPSPRAAVQGSPSSSIVSSPAGANVSRPGHTPHPRRSSVGLAFLGHDVSMLMDTTRPNFVSDTDESEEDEPSNNLLVRRGVMGPGRLMTPANSQESQVSSSHLLESQLTSSPTHKNIRSRNHLHVVWLYDCPHLQHLNQAPMSKRPFPERLSGPDQRLHLQDAPLHPRSC
jgi:hypothetical protein